MEGGAPDGGPPGGGPMGGGPPGGAAREVDELEEVGRLEEAPGVEGVMGLFRVGAVDLRFLELLDDPDATK